MDTFRHIYRFVLNVIFVYISVVLTGVLFGLITTGSYDPEGLAFVLAFDGPIDTVSIILIAYVLSIFGKFMLKPYVLIPLTVAVQILLLTLAHTFVGKINLYTFFFVHLAFISLCFFGLKFYFRKRALDA